MKESAQCKNALTSSRNFLSSFSLLWKDRLLTRRLSDGAAPSESLRKLCNRASGRHRGRTRQPAARNDMTWQQIETKAVMKRRVFCLGVLCGALGALAPSRTASRY
eukprot:scaffold4161_cov218-Pinguiococcus_pyrenoidosus.AAC.3